MGIFFVTKKSTTAQNFVRLPISFFPFIDRPTIKIEIENKKYSLSVDLGSSHPIDLHKHPLKSINNKKNLEVANYIGIRGKTYPTRAFQLPQVKLLNLCIDGLIGFEENLDFLNDAKTYNHSGLWSRLKDHLAQMTIDGRAGWPLFKETIVLFDFPHSTLVIAKDMPSFIHEAGCSLNKFTQVPFEIQKWGLVLTVETDLGLQKFLLDTGATCSIMRSSLFNQELRANNLPFITNKLRIGNNNFGSWSFRLFDYNSEIECDGILGIDFFQKHMICLDFQNQTAYVK